MPVPPARLRPSPHRGGSQETENCLGGADDDEPSLSARELLGLRSSMNACAWQPLRHFIQCGATSSAHQPSLCARLRGRVVADSSAGCSCSAYPSHSCEAHCTRGSAADVGYCICWHLWVYAGRRLLSVSGPPAQLWLWTGCAKDLGSQASRCITNMLSNLACWCKWVTNGELPCCNGN